jgi:predicted amidohydrolase YtcJ
MNLTDHADAVLHNGIVRTMDDAGTVADAIALSGDRVLATGSSAAMLALRGPGAVTFDLRGRAVLPGLIDSHNHLLSTGLNLDAIDLSGMRTVADVLDAVRLRAGSTPPGEWLVTSSRWHETQLQEARFPTRHELDAAAPAHPVLIRRGGHNIVANSAALHLGGVDSTTPDPPGGTYVRRDGDLTGHVIGAPAYARIVSRIPAPDESQMVEAIAAASSRFAAAGLTGVIEPGLSQDQIAAFHRAKAQRALAVRAVLMQRLAPGMSAGDRERAELQFSNLPTPDEDDLLRTGGIKIVADGGVETNFLREPYAFADDPTAPRGKPQVSLENLTAVCHLAARAGRQLGVHCVGDGAIDLVLDAFEAANNELPIAPLRWTLIHMTLAHPDQLDRAGDLGLVLTVQQPLIYALGAGWVKYWGGDRAGRASPMRAYAGSGLPVGGGSDSPVTPYQPLLGIWSSVTRATEFAGILGPEWGCTVEQALWMYTRGSAYCSFDEHRRGQLTPGFLADLVVLAADPVAAPVDEIRHLPVELTLLGGKAMHGQLG